MLVRLNVVLNLAKRAKDIFKESEIEEKRELLGFLFQNLKLNGKKLEFELKTPFDTVLQASKCSSMLSAIREFRTAIKEHKGYWKFKIVREWPESIGQN